MVEIQMHFSADPVRFERMNTSEIRDNFLVSLYEPGVISLVYSFIDRAVVGSAVPVNKRLKLECPAELASEYFAQRREIGVMNIGNSGKIVVDGTEYSMGTKDALYIGKGSKEIVFSSDNKDEPAKFFVISFPAHAEYPTKQARVGDAEPVHLGNIESSNKRTIYKYIHPNGIKSCQLVMGFTELEKGSVWNTMAAHTHPRRCEVYMYFGMEEDVRVFHFMGKPDETRHIVVKDGQAILSPSWSIHSGCGTGRYSFLWAMGGENQDFDDMDKVATEDLR